MDTKNLSNQIQPAVPEIETGFVVFLPVNGDKAIVQTDLSNIPKKRVASPWDILRMLEDVKMQLTMSMVGEETVARGKKASENNGEV